MKTVLSPVFDIDPARLRLTARTAIASCVALGLGTLIGLDHPQWAAMTVWIVALPTRGQRLERSLARIFGTIIGAVAGVVLIAISQGNPAALVLGLTIWLGLCAGTGNLLTGPMAYVSLLAGYSAAMVSLLGHGDSGSIWLLATDRIVTICLGGLIGTLAGFLFAPKATLDLARRMRDAMHGTLDAIAAGTAGQLDTGQQAQVISKIAAMDENLDVFSAGSAQARRRVRAIRQLFSEMLELLMHIRLQAGLPAREIDHTLPSTNDDVQGDDVLEQLNVLASQLAGTDPDLAERLRNLGLAWQQANRTVGTLELRRAIAAVPPRHRDWIGARYAGLRCASAVAATSILWLVTGWQFGPFMVMGAAIMTSVFSTFPNPGLQMRWVVGGSLAGAAAAVVAHVLIMPAADGHLQAALLTMPLILVGAPVMAHRRIALAGMEYNLIYLLMMNPMLPIDADALHALIQACAVVLGPIAAFCAFLVFPIDAGRRLDFMVKLILRELASMARDNFDAARGHDHWRARIYHRIVALVRLAERSGHDEKFAADGGISAFGLGNALVAIRRMMASDEIDNGSRRALRAAMLSVDRLPSRPDRVIRAFERAAAKLQRRRPQDAITLSSVAAMVAANQSFFRRGD